MECGKLTAKLRDAVPVCFIEDGKEVKRFKNIEIPDEIKQLPFVDFKFDVPASGAITFKIMFEAGILPTEWPEARQRKSRKVANAEVEVPHTEITEALAEALDIAEAEGQPMHELAEAVANGSEISVTMDGPEMTIETVEPESTVVSFNVTGEERKALVEAISAHLGIRHIYQNAPTFAYVIGDYRVDKAGTLTGPANEPLVAALHAKGFDEDK